MTIDEQIASAQREVAMRQRTYARWVQDGRMKPAIADREIAAMMAIVSTLQRCKDLQEIGDDMIAKYGKACQPQPVGNSPQPPPVSILNPDAD